MKKLSIVVLLTSSFMAHSYEAARYKQVLNQIQTALEGKSKMLKEKIRTSKLHSSAVSSALPGQTSHYTEDLTSFLESVQKRLKTLHDERGHLPQVKDASHENHLIQQAMLNNTIADLEEQIHQTRRAESALEGQRRNSPSEAQRYDELAKKLRSQILQIQTKLRKAQSDLQRLR